MVVQFASNQWFKYDPIHGLHYHLPTCKLVDKRYKSIQGSHIKRLQKRLLPCPLCISTDIRNSA